MCVGGLRMPHSLKRPYEDLQEEETLKYGWRAFRVDSTDTWWSSSAPFWRPFNFYGCKALSSQPWGVSGESRNVSGKRPTALQSLTRKKVQQESLNLWRAEQPPPAASHAGKWTPESPLEGSLSVARALPGRVWVQSFLGLGVFGLIIFNWASLWKRWLWGLARDLPQILSLF